MEKKYKNNLTNCITDYFAGYIPIIMKHPQRAYDAGKHKSAPVILAGLVALLNAGCGTIMCGPTQDIYFSSTPAGAEVKIDGIPMGCAPTVLELERRRGHSVCIEKEGYKPYYRNISTRLSGAFWANLLIWGIPGFIVDFMSGAQNKLYPENIHAMLSGSETQEKSLNNLIELKKLKEEGIITEQEYQEKIKPLKDKIINSF